MKKKILLVVTLLFILLIHGCSEPSIEKENVNGNGLELDFKISNLKKTKDIGILYYTLSLENTGYKDVILERNDLKINTLSGETPFKENLAEQIKDKIFQGKDKIRLVQGLQPIVVKSTAKVKKEYIEDSLNQKIMLNIEASYPYKTIIGTNMKVNTANYENPVNFNIEGQAAPVKIEKIKTLLTDIEERKAELRIYLDKYTSGNKHTYITNLETPSLKLGTESLNDCGWESQSSDSVENYFSKNSYYRCNTKLKYKNYNTQLAGEISYKFHIKDTAEIKIPHEK